MEEIYKRDFDAFKGPKRSAREQAIRKFRAILTWWTLLGILSLASVTILPTTFA